MAAPAKRKKSTESWTCELCNASVFYGGLSKLTFEQARRKLRQDCRDRGCPCKPFLADAAYKKWKQEEKAAEGRKLIEEYKRERLEVGRFGKIQQ